MITNQYLNFFIIIKCIFKNYVPQYTNFKNISKFLEPKGKVTELIKYLIQLHQQCNLSKNNMFYKILNEAHQIINQYLNNFSKFLAV